jgi:hypothetical protein
MRVLVWLLLAAVLILTGAYPTLATSVGSLLLAAFGLALHGAAALIAQPAVQLALAAAGVVWAVRTRPRRIA